MLRRHGHKKMAETDALPCVWGARLSVSAIII